jgi:hypothetical protein
MMVINLSLLGMNIPFFFEVGAPLLVLFILLGLYFLSSNQKRIPQPLIFVVPCIFAAAVSDPIASFWLRSGGAIATLIVSYVSFYCIDESCTVDFKTERWKAVMADISLISTIGMSFAHYVISPFWVFLVIYLVSLVYVYYLLVGFTSSRYISGNLTCNSEQRSLFGINDDEI